jgi:hyperosmotically inducible protein
MKLLRLPVRAATLVLALAALAACSKAPEPAAANVSDIDITEHVKTALLQAESLKGQDITVVTRKGDVRLTGTLATQVQIDEALRIARAATRYRPRSCAGPWAAYSGDSWMRTRGIQAPVQR